MIALKITRLMVEDEEGAARHVCRRPDCVGNEERMTCCFEQVSGTLSALLPRVGHVIQFACSDTCRETKFHANILKEMALRNLDHLLTDEHD